MNKHTSLPYHVYADFNIQNSKGDFICSGGISGREGLSRENIRFIVKACNNHYELIKRLEITNIALKAIQAQEALQSGIYIAIQSLLDFNEKAITKAKG